MGIGQNQVKVYWSSPVLVGLISKVLFELYLKFAGISSNTGWKAQENSNLSKRWPAANTTSHIEDVFVIALSISLIILPFLPATNLFFYVGFVVAEHLLYIPSLGYCLLLAYGFSRVAQHHPSFSRLCLTVVIISCFENHQQKQGLGK